MRICFYTATALPKLGGQEVVVDTLARHFQAMGHEVQVLAPRPRHATADDASLPYPVVRHPQFFSTRHLVGWYRRWLLKTYRWNPFDILHCHDVYPTGYLAALCREEIRTPLVITSHGGDVREGNARLLKPGLTERHVQALASADALIAISRFTEEGFLRLHPLARNIVQIPNGVNADEFAEPVDRPADLDAKIVANRFAFFIGRLHARKGIDVLLESMRQVSEADRLHLVIAGDGDERAALEAQAERLGLSSQVTFLGRTIGQKKTWLLQNARVTVIPSRTWESFGLVVLESYAAGRPVIASRLPGMQELVDHRRTGLLVTSESVSELAAALALCGADSGLTDTMGQTARFVAQRYTWREIARRHLELFDQLRQPKQLRRAA